MADRIGEVRCSQVDDADIPLIAAVTGVSPRAVARRLRNAHGNTLVRSEFGDEWPSEAADLAPLTLASARRAGLEEEIAAVTGLGVRAVRNRLNNEHGKTLVGNAFGLADEDEEDEEDEEADDEEEEDDGEEDEEDEEDEDQETDDGAEEEAEGAEVPAEWAKFASPRKVPALELVGAIRVVSVRGAAPFVDWIAPLLRQDPRSVRRALKSAHGRTMLETLFSASWPIRMGEAPRAVIGGLNVASVRRSPSLIRWVADLAGLPPQEAFDQLRGAHGNTRVDKVLPAVATAAPPAAAKRPPRADSEPPPSDRGTVVIDGKYTLGRRLGRGGFGSVYEAMRREHPRERVAIKLELPGSPTSLRAEIGVAWELTHQNICSYKDFGTDPTHGTYVVLQFGGRSLESIIDRQGVFDRAVAMDLVRQAAAGLDWAHRKGVIHQDIKPGNILVAELDDGWDVRVTDFGIAVKGKPGKNTSGKHTVFASQAIGYTQAYAAPEQLLGGKPRKASDQYSLALVFCSMLEGEVFSTRYTPREFARLSPRQNAALMKALSDDPDDRFESCSAFAVALRAR